MSKKKLSEEARFERNYKKLALIVQTYGDAYLPIFKYMHEEREKRKLNQDLKAIAALVAESNLN